MDELFKKIDEIRESLSLLESDLEAEAEVFHGDVEGLRLQVDEFAAMLADHMGEL